MKNFQSIAWAILLATLVSITLTSCNIKSSGLKPSTGKTNELLIVTNSKANWNGLMGKEIKEFFGQDLIGLPQPESMYSMAHIPELNFGEMFKIEHDVESKILEIEIPQMLMFQLAQQQNGGLYFKMGVAMDLQDNLPEVGKVKFVEVFEKNPSPVPEHDHDPRYELGQT